MTFWQRVLKSYLFYYSDYNFQEGSIFLVLEFMRGGSLADTLKMCGLIPEVHIAAIAKQVLLGLLYLHTERRIIHRFVYWYLNGLIEGSIF